MREYDAAGSGTRGPSARGDRPALGSHNRPAMRASAAVLIAVGLAAAVTCAAVAPAAGNGPPITNIAGDRQQVAITFVGYGVKDLYGIEVSRQNVVRPDGHFAVKFLTKQGLPLRYDQSQTV